MSSTSAVKSLSLGAAFLGELEHEAATTRKILERLPDDKFDWKPHERSMSFSRLAVHTAEMFGWIKSILETPGLDFATMDYKPFEPKSSAELLEFFEKNISEAADALRSAADETLAGNWTMQNGETVYFTKPKSEVLRMDCLNHIIHHRGQLSVYLRLNEIPVPEIYGPSADEGQM